MVFSKNFYNKFDPFTKFSYLLIDRNKPQEQKFIFSKCRPKSGVGKEKNSWSENARIIQKFYGDFLNQAQSVHKRVYSKTGGLIIHSYMKLLLIYFKILNLILMEMIIKKEAVIVSDMMQHSKRLSFYSACNAKSIKAKCPSFKDFMRNLSDKDYLLSYFT